MHTTNWPPQHPRPLQRVTPDAGMTRRHRVGDDIATGWWSGYRTDREQPLGWPQVG